MASYCISCKEVVKRRMHAISCDGCKLWQHRKCKNGTSTGITTEEYRQMKKGDLNIEWKCIYCMVQHMENSKTPLPPDVSITVSPIRDFNTTYVVRQEGDTSYIADRSFDIQGRNFHVQAVPLDNSPTDRLLDVSIPPEQPLTFQIVEGGSTRGGQKLISSDGYTYTCRNNKNGRVYWTCSVRNKSLKCYASVKQFGDLFTPSIHGHQHPAEPGALKKVLLSTKVKKAVREDMLRPTGDIVESVCKEIMTADDFDLTKPEYLVRRANHHRQRLRLKEPIRL